MEQAANVDATTKHARKAKKIVKTLIKPKENRLFILEMV
jgi:hypothetical protein